MQNAPNLSIVAEESYMLISGPPQLIVDVGEQIRCVSPALGH